MNNLRQPKTFLNHEYSAATLEISAFDSSSLISPRQLPLCGYCSQRTIKLIICKAIEYFLINCIEIIVSQAKMTVLFTRFIYTDINNFHYILQSLNPNTFPYHEWLIPWNQVNSFIRMICLFKNKSDWFT